MFNLVGNKHYQPCIFQFGKVLDRKHNLQTFKTIWDLKATKAIATQAASKYS